MWAVFVPNWDRLRFGSSRQNSCAGRLTGWCQVNNEAITNIHSPVLVGAPEDLNQVPNLWFLIILKIRTNRKNLTLQHIVFGNKCSTFDLTGVSDIIWVKQT